MDESTVLDWFIDDKGNYGRWKVSNCFQMSLKVQPMDDQEWTVRQGTLQAVSRAHTDGPQKLFISMVWVDFNQNGKFIG